MLGFSGRTAILACAASAVLVRRLVPDCSASLLEGTAPLGDVANDEQTDFPAFPEGRDLSDQAAPKYQENQVHTPAQIEAATEGANKMPGAPPAKEISTKDEHAFTMHFVEGRKQHDASLRNPFKGAARRRHEAPLDHERQEADDMPVQKSHLRRLELLEGLSQLVQPISAMSNLLNLNLSPRDKDQLETFARRVATSRERVYRDLLFVTGGKFQGMDEYDMKQLVAKVGLEHMSSGYVPPNIPLSSQESTVLDAAKRGRFHVDRIISTYEREVSQHARTLRQELETNSQHALRGKIDSIVSDGLFKKHVLSVRRLQAIPRNRRLSGLLQGPGLLNTAGSLLRSIDPSNLNASLNSSLNGLGLHHMNLNNIGRLGSTQNGGLASIPLTDVSGLRRALEAIFPQPQQAAALSPPLRSFQQGVSTSTDGAIGAFLSKEGLLPFLSVDSAKRMLGGLIGGEAIAPHGIHGWEDLGLSPAAAEGAAGVMPFQTFLQKLGLVAQEVDSDVGFLKRETKLRIRSEGIPLLPHQMSQVDALLDRLVWGSLQAPRRRLQENTDIPVDTGAKQIEKDPHTDVDEDQQGQQQQAEKVQKQQLGHPETVAVKQQHQPATQEVQPQPQPEEIQPQPRPQIVQQKEQGSDKDDASLGSLFNLLMAEEGLEGIDVNEKMDSALQRVELLADAISVLLTEYERAVEHLQDLLDEQVDAAEDIKDELEEQLKELQNQVKKKQQRQYRQAEAAAAEAAASVAKAFDEAMESLKESLEGLLKEEQEKESVPAPVQQELAALAAKIEAAAHERLLQRPAAATAH